MNVNEINKKLRKLLALGDMEVERLIKLGEKELVSIYKKALRSIKTEIAKMFERYGDSVNYSEMVKYNRLTNLEQTISKIIKKLTGEVIKTSKVTIKSIFEENYYRTGYAIENSLALQLYFGLLDNNTIKAALYNPMDRIKWPERLREHARIYVRAIKQELAQGLVEGKGYGEIAKRITEKSEITATKAIRIIRTEGHRVQNASRIIALEKTEKAADNLGIKTERIWVATLDERTRSSHQKMDGQKARMINGELQFRFPSGVTTIGPGLSGIAEEDINCRCSVITKLSNHPPKLRKDNVSKKLISYMNYEEWKKGLK